MPSPAIEAYTFHQQSWDSYDQLREAFEWEVPESFNIATYICDRWADATDRIAVYGVDEAGERTEYTYERLRRTADSLANYLESRGVGTGDRIAVNTPQRPETLLTHLAAWKLGAISVPLTSLLGPDGLEYRLVDSGATAAVVGQRSVEAFREAAGDSDVETVLTVGDVETGPGEEAFWKAIEDVSDSYETAAVDAETGAYIIYTSGTTGEPKGVLHAHDSLLGSLPFFLTTGCNLELEADFVHWTPIEWSWIGSLLTSVLPTLYYGRSVVAYDRQSFDPTAAFRIIDDYEVTLYSGPPTTLRMMQSVDRPSDRYDLSSLRVLLLGGESADSAIIDWAADVFDATVHEGYGQTEANAVVGHCSALFEFRPGTIGKPAPGHEVRLVEPATGAPLDATGETGEMALRYDGDPTCFREFWNNPEATAEKVQDGWLLTEDLARVDADGYFEFAGRTDDVIISSGYRIGPGEIEETLTAHPAVAAAGVVGVSDDQRGEIPKAFVVCTESASPDDALREELMQFVKDRLAKYEYPRELAFIDELPTTETGKLRREDLRPSQDRI